MPEYKVRQVSQAPAREYYNEKFKSTTYYIKVMLEGHDKPVEIGKKKPDALKAGDIVYGSIEKTGYETDTWHREDPPNSNFGGGSSGGGGSRGGDREPFKPDPVRQADIKAEWAIGKVIDSIGVEDLKKVEEISRKLYVMVDAVKVDNPVDSGDKSAPASDPDGFDTPAPASKPPVTTEFGDEPINLDDIPF